MTDDGVSKRPGPWWVLAEAIRPSDGARLAVHWMKESIDRVEQVLVNQRRYEVWHEDRLVQQEFRTMTLRWYYKHEMLLMLEKAGFRDISVDASSQRSSRLLSDMWLFTARK